MIDAIFVDMDGVTVDFYRGALELYGFDPNMDLSDKSYDELEIIFGPHGRALVSRFREWMYNLVLKKQWRPK